MHRRVAVEQAARSGMMTRALSSYRSSWQPRYQSSSSYQTVCRRDEDWRSERTLRSDALEKWQLPSGSRRVTSPPYRRAQNLIGLVDGSQRAGGVRGARPKVKPGRDARRAGRRSRRRTQGRSAKQVSRCPVSNRTCSTDGALSRAGSGERSGSGARTLPLNERHRRLEPMPFA